jgi:hypothetical protein
LFYGVGGDTSGGGVVCGDEGGSLGPAEFAEGGAERDAFFGVDEDGVEFGFGGGTDNVFEDVGGVKDSTFLDVRGRQLIAKVEVTAGAAAGFPGFVQVSGIAVDFELHVAGVVSDFGSGMCGIVVQELVDAGLGQGGGSALFRGEGAESNVHGGIDGTGIV